MEYKLADLPRYSMRTVDSTQMLSACIAVYRPQAELFGGRSDGKFVVRLGKD
jgi:hypothetical protein